MNKYKVVEIFDSIDGEGKRAGSLVSFVRLAGCNLRCSYCDTLYALFDEDEPCRFTYMTGEEIINKLNPLYKRVTLTGGEPLIAPNVSELIMDMIKAGYEVNIETNGAVDISEISKSSVRDKLFFTIDYKLPTSNMCHKMIWDNFLKLNTGDVIKFVVGNNEDIIKMSEVIKELRKHYEKMPLIYAGAVYNEISLDELVGELMKREEFCDVKLQLQLHKIIWDPDMRGV